jgi:hypothetical protein
MNYGDSDAVASSRGLTGKRTVTVVPRSAGHRLKVLRIFRIENVLQASCCNRATRSRLVDAHAIVRSRYRNATGDRNQTSQAEL